MVGIEIQGGLGNQMFEYAFIYANAKANRSTFFLLKRGEPIMIYKYFKLEKNLFYIVDRLFFHTASVKLLFSHYLRGFFYKFISTLKNFDHISISNTEDPAIFLKQSAIYHGYFQSYLYFKDYESDIKKIFEIKPKFIKRYQQKYAALKDKKIVAIHIRKTDYADLGHLNLGKADLSLPLTYFTKVIDQIHEPDNFYVFVSDDIQAIKPHFAYLANTYFSADHMINDFLHLYFAETIVMSNSTFSWWAAYLNKNPNKRVYCPKYFLGHVIKEEYPAKIYPPDWQQITVH